MTGVDVGAGCFKVLVLAVQQIKQRALANFKLLAVGLARLLGREPMLVLVTLLRCQAVHIAVGNGQGLTNIAASLGLQVTGLLALVNRLALARLVGSATKKVVGQQ